VLQSYNCANYVSDRLTELYKKPVTVYNLSIAACMASDANLLASRILRSKERPKVIVYPIFPRDFNDNLIAPFGSTPAFKCIGTWQEALSPGMAQDTIQELLAY